VVFIIIFMVVVMEDTYGFMSTREQIFSADRVDGLIVDENKNWCNRRYGRSTSVVVADRDLARFVSFSGNKLESRETISR
jgi:hypothetical protein